MIKNKNDVIILAAGNSQRFRDKQKKQNKKISNQSLVDIAIRYFINRKEINNIFVAYNKKIPLNTKYKSKIIFVTGGITRSHSVYNVLNHIITNYKPSNNIIIHDVARPYINKTDLNKLLKIFTTTGIALGYPLTNAIKYVNNNHVVESNIDRNNLVASFTPQKFNFKKLYNAYKKVINDKINVDDDLEVMTYDSHKVKIMISSPGNIKITYKDDLYVLSKLLS